MVLLEQWSPSSLTVDPNQEFLDLLSPRSILLIHNNDKPRKNCQKYLKKIKSCQEFNIWFYNVLINYISYKNKRTFKCRSNCIENCTWVLILQFFLHFQPFHHELFLEFATSNLKQGFNFISTTLHSCLWIVK